MSVLSLYAHTLSYEEPGDGHRDPETGDYIKGNPTWVEDYCECDVIPAGKANEIQIPDGTVETYSYTISNLPTSCREFQYGDKVRIKLYGNEDNNNQEQTRTLVREFKVLGFHRYQLQCKLWV